MKKLLGTFSRRHRHGQASTSNSDAPQEGKTPDNNPRPRAPELEKQRASLEPVKTSQDGNVTDRNLVPDMGASVDPAGQGSKTNLTSASRYLLGGTKISLSTLQAIAGLVPIPWLGSAIGAAIQVITVVEAVSSNSSQSLALQERTYGLMVVVITPLQGKSEEELSQGSLKTSIDRLAGDLSDIADDLRIIRADTNFRQLSALPKAILTYQDIQGRISDCSAKLDWAMKVFQVESHLQSRLDDLQRHSEVLNAIRIIDNRLDVNARIAKGNLLEQTLKPADALYNSHSRKAASSCLEGTRVALLQQIGDWIYNNDPGQLRMMYLYGLAGTGKSTIAETIARYCAEAGNLGATFFFARDYTERREAVNVFPTIAYQLASLVPSFQEKLVKTVQANPGVYRSGLLEQLTKLIIDPLRDAVDAPSPLVFVFDALDECGDASDAQELLKLLAFAIKQLPPRLRLRIFMTSRPEVSLQAEFASSVTGAISHVAELHNIEDHIVQADIRLYLHSRLQTPPEIATDDEIERLVKMARNLFIVASTAVKFVEDSFYSSLNGRKAQLKVVLLAEDSYSDPKMIVKATISEGMERGPPPYRALDAMYLTILSKALPEERNAYLEGRLRSVLGAVVVLFDTLSPRALEALLGLETDTTSDTLERLHSIIVFPDHDPDSTPLRLIHPSFPNFLTTSSRCTDVRFYVNPVMQHSQLALICLNHMNNLLTRDICNIGFLPTLNSEVEDLQAQLRGTVPPYLRYACYHWSSHLALCKPESEAKDEPYEEVTRQLARAVDTFVCARLLYWLEVLSLLGRLDTAIPLLRLAERGLMGMPDVSNDTIPVLKDAQRFVMRFFEPISLGSGCIYSSALPFTPKCRLYDIYQSELHDTVVVRLGQEMGWDPCLRVVRVGSEVFSIAFSPNGDRLASGSVDGVVRLLDVQTGTVVGSLRGHSGLVRSVVFSPAGDRLASGCVDKTVRMWDVQTGAEVATLQGHTDQISSVAFSPKGDSLASASYDKTIRLWAAQTGTEVAVLGGRNSNVDCVVFSPDGNLLASGSWDALVHVWDVNTGAEVSILNGHWSHVTSIAFSPNGDRLASGSYDHTARIWDMQTGAVLATLSGHRDWINSIAFSPQGDRLASSSVDNSTRLWDAATGVELSRLKGHSSHVSSVVFSPKGDRLASGSGDTTIRLWDVEPGVEFTPLKCHSGSVVSVKFSSKGDRLASGAYDNTVRLWNVHPGAEVATLEGDSLVSFVSFSPDGQRVKYQYFSGKEEEWDVTKFPFTPQADDPSQSSNLTADHRVLWKSPWILYDGWRLCRLGAHILSWESKGALIALGADSGEVFLLDFTTMIHRIWERRRSGPYGDINSDAED
ncbi:hypothetical protein FRB93_011389 [Tulasnella sp. JGI-2019a]|nr:hypothetical protein FRB93_011389 [Tulasnella sp. JGI-2019a]